MWNMNCTKKDSSVQIGISSALVDRQSVGGKGERQINDEMESPEHKQQQQQSKLPRVKAFRLVRKKFATAGICPELVTQSYPINGRILFGFLTLGFTFSCQLVFISNDAQTFAEYTQSIYLCSLSTLITLAVTILILKTATMYEFMNGVDETLNTGKSGI